MNGYKILVVEDDKKMRDGLFYVMTKEGYEVDAVDSGEAALGRIKNHAYDLVISDMKLPGI
ncbi:MAG TPA: response regulator, partial [bacterium]|nr:response regulator [bacterium]